MNKPKMKILIIIHDEAERKRIFGILRKTAMQCFISDSGQSAVKFLENEPVNIVLFAVQGEGSDVDIIRDIKKNNPDAALIILVNQGPVGNIADFIRHGADSILPKSANKDWLLYTITSVIEKQKIYIAGNEQLKELERAIENRTMELDRTKKLLDQNFTETIKTFVGLLDTRDHILGSHLKRVSTFCRAISERYDLNERVKREIEIGALLHDIGKIGIPDSILKKTRDYFMLSQLTLKELKVIRTHPVIGQEAVEMIDILKHISVYIRNHHEHFDGSGYPDGLSGFHIPLGARIIRVADAYDRIVFGVAKIKQKSAHELFLKHLRKYTGHHYDPEVAEHFIAFLREMRAREKTREKRILVNDLTTGMVLSRDVLTRGGVLLISQFERITENEIKRLKRFQRSNLLMDGITIYESPKFLKSEKTVHIEKHRIPDEQHEEVGFRKVCDAIDSIKDFRTLPEIYHSAMSLLSDPKSNRSDIAGVLKRDQVMTAKILRIVNSTLFGFSRTITTLEDAIPLLGFKEIRNIVTSATVLKLMSDTGGSDIFDRKKFWKHSIGCAIVCKLIAKYIGVSTDEEYFTAGLLHDIGKLVLDQLFPNEFRKVLVLVDEQSIPFRKAERHIFGQPHQEIGSYLLEKWKIPAIVIDAVRNHHSPVDGSVDPLLVSAVHISDIIAHMLAIGSSGENTVPKFEDYAESQLGIGIIDLDQLVPEIDEQVRKSDDLLFLSE